MRTLTITKALPTAGQPEDLTIEFAGSPPIKHVNLEQAGNFYQLEAGLLFDALINTLPGGTLDALLRKLLEHRASLLAVPHFTQTNRPTSFIISNGRRPGKSFAVFMSFIRAIKAGRASMILAPSYVVMDRATYNNITKPRSKPSNNEPRPQIQHHDFFCQFMGPEGVCTHPDNTTTYCYKDVCLLQEPAADLDAVEQWMHYHGGHTYQEGGDIPQEPPEPDDPF